MRSSWKTLVAVTAALVVVPQLAAADDVQEQLNQMQARMAQLEDSLKATQDELNTAQTRVEEQEAVITRTVEDSKAVSALSSFLSDTEFGGAVAASYNWNFMGPSAKVAGNNVALGEVSTNPQHNTFQFDQAHFSMEKTATEKSRGGFKVDLLYGAIADANELGATNGNVSWVVEANASYLAPVAGGLEITGGRFATPIGAEVVYTEDNWNITRGSVWALQPISHTGVAVRGEYGNFWGQAAGANSSTDANLDGNAGKTGLFTAGWENDALGFTTTYMYADDPAGNIVPPLGPQTEGDTQHFVDVVGTWDPSDNLAVWMNFDYIRTNVGVATGVNTYGMALASRLAVSDATGVAIRGEWIGLEPGGGAPIANAYEVTGTVDHALTDHVTAKVEVRWDNADTSPFIQGTENNQVVALGQIIYEF